MPITQFVNIRNTIPLESPDIVRSNLPASDEVNQFVFESRQAVEAILAGQDSRLMAIVGPCSIHDKKSCLEYATRLSELREKVADQILILMRVYFEKPRTTIGWKGLINDPHMNNSFEILEGLQSARQILLEISNLNLPAASEILEPVTPLYISDLITVASIGARTAESPTHRQMASGLSMPVGHKNGTDGDLKSALDAMKSALHPHSFLGINNEGVTSIIHTTGNKNVFPILRGGRSGPNFSAEQIDVAIQQLNDAKLLPRLLVDCSHANSEKDYRNQGKVWNNVIDQRIAGNDAIVGLMLESHLNADRQDLTDDPSSLQYGVSITDSCIDWAETESLVLDAHAKLAVAK